MADTVAGRLHLDLEFFEGDDEVLRSGALKSVMKPPAIFGMAAGTTDGKVDRLFAKRITITASGTYDLDLAGALTDAVGGESITMAKVRGLVVVNRSTTSGDNVSVGPKSGAALTSFWVDASDRSIVYAGITGQPGLLLKYNPRGSAVTAATGDSYRFTELGGVNTVTLDVYVWGTSA